MGMYVFTNFCRIYFDMDHLCLSGIFAQIAGDAVIEAHSDCDEDIALVLLDIGAIVAVHTQHTHVQRVVRR